MDFDINAALAEIRRLRERIDAMPAGPAREALKLQRDELRAQARLAGDAARPRSHLEAELSNVDKQLAAIDTDIIKPATHEHYKLITDPAAYRRRINQKIRANEAARLAALEQRRAELLAALEANQDD